MPKLIVRHLYLSPRTKVKFNCILFSGDKLTFVLAIRRNAVTFYTSQTDDIHRRSKYVLRSFVSINPE